jgi:hypothetical protein
MGDSKMKWEIGDKVKLTGGGYADTPTNPHWGGKYGYVVGIICNIDYSIHVDWANEKSNVYGAGDITLIEERYKPLDDLIKFIEKELVI